MVSWCAVPASDLLTLYIRAFGIQNLCIIYKTHYIAGGGQNSKSGSLLGRFGELEERSIKVYHGSFRDHFDELEEHFNKVYCGLFRGRFEELGEHFNRVCYGSTRSF